jgi:hypothetical protein
VQGADNPSAFTIVFNADSSANITNTVTGESAQITVSSVNVAGQPISTQGLDGAILLTTAGVFPAGSLRYDMTWNTLIGSYSLYDSYGNTLGTDVALIPDKFLTTQGNTVYIDSNSIDEFYAKFIGGTSNVVNIYKSWSSPTLVGTATYSIATVIGKQILEINIPQALRTQYSLGNNPIFSLAPTGFVYHGDHSTPGISYTNGNGGYNDIAINHIKANINTALAKPALSKKISKAMLGM